MKSSSSDFTIEQWLPLVHNLLFYIRDLEDRVNRTDASYGLQLFVSAASKHADQQRWMSLLEHAVLAGIERTHGVRQDGRDALLLEDLLRVLSELPESPERKHDELTLQTNLARTELAEGCGLAVGRGIKTNQFLCADTEQRIYARGDCAEVPAEGSG